MFGGQVPVHFRNEVGGGNVEKIADGKRQWLFLCFGGLSEQHAEQGGQEMFAPNTGIVHEFEKAQVQG